MTVSASDEGRVYATAQAFYSATYVDCYRQLGPEGRAMLEQHGDTLEKLARNVVNIGEYAQATLADMERETSDLMEQSKQQVQRIVSSDRSTSPLCLPLFALSACLSASLPLSLFSLFSIRLSLLSLLASDCSLTFFSASFCRNLCPRNRELSSEEVERFIAKKSWGSEEKVYDSKGEGKGMHWQTLKRKLTTNAKELKKKEKRFLLQRWLEQEEVCVLRLLFSIRLFVYQICVISFSTAKTTYPLASFAIVRCRLAFIGIALSRFWRRLASFVVSIA
jgi:hypothetical protein